jgi:hypothetical protein
VESGPVAANAATACSVDALDHLRGRLLAAIAAASNAWTGGTYECISVVTEFVSLAQRAAGCRRFGCLGSYPCVGPANRGRRPLLSDMRPMRRTTFAGTNSGRLGSA